MLELELKCTTGEKNASLKNDIKSNNKVLSIGIKYQAFIVKSLTTQAST